MTLETHIAKLENDHKQLDKEIINENARPSADQIKIGTLKKKKLQLKEKIEKLKSQGSDD